MIELWNKKAQLYDRTLEQESTIVWRELGQCKGGSTTQPWAIKATVGVTSGTLFTCVYLGTLGHLKQHCTARFWDIARLVVPYGKGHCASSPFQVWICLKENNCTVKWNNGNSKPAARHLPKAVYSAR
jgi:hypothetical protein